MSDNALDKVIQFKQFSTMRPWWDSWTRNQRSSWKREIFPSLWVELCLQAKAKVGLLVLREENGSGYSEASQFGYGEEGFYYPFLVSGGKIWSLLFGEGRPLRFSPSEQELFLKQGVGYAFALGDKKNPDGFFFVEWEGEPDPASQSLLALLSFSWGDPAPSVLEEGLSQILLRSSGNQKAWSSSLGVLALQGEEGTPFALLAEEWHRSFRSDHNFLVPGKIPEHPSKWEKALVEWEKEVAGGTLYFGSLELWTLAQQSILFQFWESGAKNCFWIFSMGEEFSLGLPSLASLLAPATLVLPKWQNLGESLRIDLVRELFLRAKNRENRRSLGLTPEAEKFLLKRKDLAGLEGIYGALRSGVLKAKGQTLQKEDLDSSDVPISSGDLNIRRTVREIEKEKVLTALRIFNGNQMHMAKALGISRGSLQYKLKQFGIQIP